MSDKQYPFPAFDAFCFEHDLESFATTSMDAGEWPTKSDVWGKHSKPCTVVSREEWDALCARIADLEAAADELARLMKKGAEVPR